MDHKKIWCSVFLITCLAAPSCEVEETYSAKLKFTSGQTGGIYQPLSRSIGSVVSKKHPGIEIAVLDSKGGTENIERLNTDFADLALVQNDSPGSTDIRTLAPLHHEVVHFLVRRDSGINKLSDIKGKRVAVGPRGSGTESFVEQLLKHYGIQNTEFGQVNLTMSESKKAILNGQIEAMFFVTGLRAKVCQEVLASGQVKLVGFGTPGEVGGEVDGFCLNHPFHEPSIIPTYSYSTPSSDHPGEPESPIATIALRSLLVARQDLPDDTAYAIVQSIFEGRSELIATNPQALEINEEFDPSTLQFPIHPGAQDYYKRNAPNFFVKYAESMGFVLSLMIALSGLIFTLAQWSARRKKNRIDEYYKSLDKLLEQANSQDISHKELHAIALQLSKMRHDAIGLLADEKLRADESFLIFQQLLSDCQTSVYRRISTSRFMSDMPPPVERQETRSSN